MAFVLCVSDEATFKVKGSLKNAKGVDEPFDFMLTCERIDQDRLSEVTSADSDETVRGFLRSIVRGWSGVKAQDGQQVEFSQQALDAMLSVLGMPVLIYRTYIAEVGVKEKN